VLELREDEHGFRDVADRGRADHDMLQGAPPLGHQGEAAFALVAQGAQQGVTGFRVDIEFAAGRLFHRDVHARAGPFIAGIGQERQVFEVGPGFRQDELAGGGASGCPDAPAGRSLRAPAGAELGEQPVEYPGRRSRSGCPGWHTAGKDRPEVLALFMEGDHSITCTTWRRALASASRVTRWSSGSRRTTHLAQHHSSATWHFLTRVINNLRELWGYLLNRPDGADLVTVSLVDLAELAAVESDEDLFALMAAHCPYCATPLR